MNISQCPVCASFITDISKQGAFSGLRMAKQLEGFILCEMCEYQLRIDFEHGYDVKQSINEYKSENEKLLRMDNKIMLTISYLSDVQTNDFWNKNNGLLKPLFKNSLNYYFPKKMRIDKLRCNRQSLSHVPSKFLNKPSRILVTLVMSKRRWILQIKLYKFIKMPCPQITIKLYYIR